MFACIFIPDFTVEAVLRAEPILRGQAVAVLEGAPPLCYVVGINDAARQMGVQIGMTRMQVEGEREVGGKTVKRQNGKTESNNTQNGEPNLENYPGYWHGSLYRSGAGEALVAPPPHPRSKKINEHSERLTLRHRSPAQESSAHAALLDAAHAISPRVEDTAVDTVVLDVAGLDRLFGTPQQVAQELSHRVTEVGLQGNVAISANPDAAEHAARGYNGLTIIPPGREAERLGTLPLEILFHAELATGLRQETRRDQQREIAARLTRMQQTLDRWGIRNFRGLATLPPVSLSERLGTNGVRLQTLACGAAIRELVLSDPPLRFEETIELEYPVDVLEPLAFLLARMLDVLCGRLNARALSTNELRLRLRLEHRTGDEAAKSKEELQDDLIVERKLTLPVPMNDPKLFLKLLQLELSAIPPGAPVTQLWLQAEPARPRVGQAGLFMPLTPEPQKLELTLARIHKLLGVRDVLRAGSAELLDTHEPDAFRVVRFQPVSEEQRQNGKTAKRLNEDQSSTKIALDAGADLAVRRYRPPFAAEVETRGGLPVRVMCSELGTQRALHDNVVWAAGPWRSSGNWWGTRSEDRKSEGSEKQLNSNSSGVHQKTEMVAEEHFWDREEWDIALAVTVRGPDRRERETQIGLYRLTWDRIAERWTVEGCYD